MPRRTTSGHVHVWALIKVTWSKISRKEWTRALREGACAGEIRANGTLALLSRARAHLIAVATVKVYCRNTKHPDSFITTGSP